MNIFEKLEKKEASLAVIGLGYVGLPIALEFAKKIKVVGFDINQKRVEMMRNNIDPSDELDAAAFEGADIHFTADINDLKSVQFFIIAVPTPVDDHNVPDLTPVLKASETVGKVLKKGDYVVFESTVYPGCTEEDCVPVLEKMSGLKFIEDFKVGYSPERINPGDKEHTLTKIMKVTSGCDTESADIIADVYRIVVTAGVYKAATIKVAEAAKVIENTQRDVNIALMNELSKIFDLMGINTFDVLEAAGTKWNFLKFKPGLVGGHCIGVDPYYLTYKAESLDYKAEVILSGRRINDSMGKYVADKLVQKLALADKKVSQTKVLVMGATFKEDVSDIRNSKVSDVIKALKAYSINVEVVDPHADSEELMHEYGFGLIPSVGNNYDAIIVAVNHRDYNDLQESYFTSLMGEKPILMDIKGIFKGKMSQLNYWSL